MKHCSLLPAPAPAGQHLMTKPHTEVQTVASVSSARAIAGALALYELHSLPVTLRRRFKVSLSFCICVMGLDILFLMGHLGGIDEVVCVLSDEHCVWRQQVLYYW